MKNFWNTFLACLLAIVASSIIFTFITFVMFAGMIAAFSSEESAYVGNNSVLKLELNENIVDNPAQSVLSTFDPLSLTVTKSVSLISVLETIERAAEDPDIDGIYLNMSDISMGMATMEEVRDALLKFRESGKFIISYSNYYSQGTYYLASVADKIYVNPEGALDWRGLASTSMFFKGTLDKLGVKTEIFRVGEFKSAVEPFMLDRMSPENREQTQVMVSSIWNNIVGEIARSRNLKAEDLQQYASELTIANPSKAVELGLIDALKYKDEVLAELSDKTYRGEELPEMVLLSEYMRAPGAKATRRLSKDKIALIYAEGDIVEGTSTDGIIGGDGLADKLARARRDESVKAVVLRVNSPGGSALASELIWREMTLIQQEKPIIVSMGDYAASGGYYIACPADVILAGKHTLTGSIGVFGVMLNLQDALRDKLGVTTDVVRTNPSADIGNSFRGTTPAERTYIQNSVEDVYDTFVGHVAKGRNLRREDVLKIAGGRVWSGINAQEIGLVDGFGGLKAAIELAADRAGISENYRVITLDDPLDQLSQLFNTFFTAKLKSAPVTTNAEQELLDGYRSLMRTLEYEGVQARMPYTYEIQ